jgi:hypothetical protein
LHVPILMVQRRPEFARGARATDLQGVVLKGGGGRAVRPCSNRGASVFAGVAPRRRDEPRTRVAAVLRRSPRGAAGRARARYAAPSRMSGLTPAGLWRDRRTWWRRRGSIAATGPRSRRARIRVTGWVERLGPRARANMAARTGLPLPEGAANRGYPELSRALRRVAYNCRPRRIPVAAPRRFLLGCTATLRPGLRIRANPGWMGDVRSPFAGGCGSAFAPAWCHALAPRSRRCSS